MFNLGNGVLKLLVQDRAVGDNDDAVEIGSAVFLAHSYELVSCPGNGIGFSRASAVLNQVRLARTFQTYGSQYVGDAFPLVKAGEKLIFFKICTASCVLGFLLFGDNKAMKNAQPVVFLQHLLPEIGDRVRVVLSRRVAFSAVIPPVEGQKISCMSRQLRSHADITVAHGEMNYGAALESQQRFRKPRLFIGRGSVFAVLGYGCFDRLGKVGFELDGSDGNSIDKKGQIQFVRFVFGIAKL